MNTLSWLLYFAEVAGNVSMAFAITSVIGLILIGSAMLISFVNQDMNNHFTDYDKQSYTDFRKKLKPYIFALLAIGFVSFIVPSSGTVYLIAASELGEEAIKSPIALEVESFVRNKLNEYKVEVPNK